MSDPDGTRALNVQATSTLALACAQRSAVLIYISSDYVFPGLRGEAPYSASATPRPPNFYGETKLAGEQAVLSSSIGGGGGGGGGGIVLRVPVLYGEVTAPEESAINVLLEAVWKSQTEDYQVEMDDWAIRYPTNTEDVARVIRDLARRYLDAQRGQQQQQQQQQTTLPRIVQFSAEEPYTKYQICLILGEIMGFSMDNMKPIKPDDDDDDEKEVSVKRPYDCHLSTKELKDIGVNIQAMDFKSWWYVYISPGMFLEMLFDDGNVIGGEMLGLIGDKISS